METSRGSLVIASGARAAERALLDALAPHVEAVRRNPALLARPVRLVVPSQSLRLHLAARLVREVGGAVAGVAITTAFGLAAEVLARAGDAAPSAGGRRLFPVLVRRDAAAEPALRQALEALLDGYAPVAATVGDLLDAGFVAGNLEGVLDCLATTPEGALRARAEALVRLALRVEQGLAEHQLVHPSALLRRAAERVEEDAAAWLPSRAVFVHGFADTTGALGDLLAALARWAGACVVLDHPPDPAPSDRPSPGEGFTERLRVRFHGLPERAAGAAPAPASLRLVEAPGAAAEVRFAAEGVRRLLDAGMEPESIALVARDLGPYRAPLRVHLGRLAVPFSGGAGFASPEGRRAHALLALLEAGDAAPADRWLDAMDRYGPLRSADLRLALHGMGVGRLRDVASLDLADLLGDAGHYALPVRRGFAVRVAPEGEAEEGALEPGGDGGDELGDAEPARGDVHASRRTVSRETLAWAVEAAGRLLARLESVRRQETLGAQLAELRRLLHHELAWRPETAGFGDVQGRLAALESDIGSGAALSFEDLRLLLRGALADAAVAPLGGEGGGVQVLSATEARGRTFGDLFVLGMNRDVFPRVIGEDPLLPDDLRRALAAVLPDVPVKGRGADEERYLFAQLLSAAPRVTLSWQAVSDDGKERGASPLVERLRLVTGCAVETAPGLWDARDPSVPRPPLEHAVAAGLAGDRAGLAAAMELALVEAGHGARAAEVAEARRAALEELDPAPGAPAARRLGPWFGLVGPAAGDPREGPLHVTRLEGMHYCPWQVFLAKVLGLQPVPDALAALPDVSALLLGNVVHGVLERIVERAGAATNVPLRQARAAGPVDVPWPPETELDGLVRRAAVDAARQEGIVLPGFAALLARRARPALARIRALEWPDGVRRGVLGAELSGSVDLSAAGLPGHALQFRADRVDVAGPCGDGSAGLVLTDYKTGNPVSDKKKPATRRRHLVAQVANGRRLQVAAYALADEGAVEGRYLFAKEGLSDAVSVASVARGDAAVEAGFASAVRVLVAAWAEGSFVPRLVGKGDAEGPACARCELVEACVRGDSGSRRRLDLWRQHEPPHEASLETVARALFRTLEDGR